MLECNMILTLFAHYTWLHSLYLFNPNTKYLYAYMQISQKIQILIFTRIAQPNFEETCISTVIFCSIRPLVASGEKPKAFLFQPNLCLKLE